MNASVTAIPVEELQALNDMAQRFARKELQAHTQEHEYPYARDIAGVLQVAGDTGLFGLNLPEACGGSGLDVSALAGVVQQVSAVDAGVAAMLFTNAAALEIIATAAGGDAACDTERDAVIRACLLANGSLPLAFPSYTAPEEMTCLAVSGGAEDGQGVGNGNDGARLSGRLPFLALGGVARYAVVPGARQPGSGFSWYLLDLHAAGVALPEPVLILGLQACQVVDVTLRDVPAWRIGADGTGRQLFHRMQARLSLPAVAMAVGLMEGSFNTALDYAGQRFQGGRHLVDWSGIRMKLADMAIRLDVARCCLSGLLATWSTGTAGNAACAAAIHAGELACNVASEGIQVLGGNGYMKDYGQEKRLRDARQARCLLGMNGLKKMHHIDTIIETCTGEQQP